MTCSGCLCYGRFLHYRFDEYGEDDSSAYGERDGLKASDVTYVGTNTSQAAN